MGDRTAAGRADQAEVEAPFELANVRPATTGLPFIVFVSQQGGARYGPRIKVTLEHPPRLLGSPSCQDVALLTRWIELNRATIEACWAGTIAFTEDMLAAIRPV